MVKQRKKNTKKKPGQAVQCELFEDDRYTYRIFCTSLSGQPHKVIAEYDKRADIENLVGEAKREGLDAILSFISFPTQLLNMLLQGVNH